MVTVQLQAKTNLLYRVKAPEQHPAYSLSTPGIRTITPGAVNDRFHIISFRFELLAIPTAKIIFMQYLC